MITRVVKKLASLQKNSVLIWFSSSDDFKDDDNPNGKKKFLFKKNEPKKDSKDQPSTQNTYQKKRFFQADKIREDEPRRIRKLGQTQSKDSPSKAPFINTLVEEEQEMGKKSIFFAPSSTQNELSRQKQTTADPQPQLKQLIQTKGSDDKFYQKFSEESSKLLATFLDRNWSQLNSMVEDYCKLTNVKDVQKLIYPLLISENVSIFLQWQSSKSKQLKSQPTELLQKIFLALIRSDELPALKKFLASIASKPIDLNYNSIETVLRGVTVDQELNQLEASLDNRVSIVLSILKIQLKHNQKVRSPRQVYALGNWFYKLANIALQRHIGIAKFLLVFEEIVIRHRQIINLQEFLESSLFIKIIQTYYYNSHIDTIKLAVLFEKVLSSQRWWVILQKLKKSLALFKIKHQKSAFPNAKNIMKELERSLANYSGQNAVFYYIIANHNDQPAAFETFRQKSASLFKNSKEVDENQRIVRLLINEGFLSLRKSQLQSQTSSKKTEHVEQSEKDPTQEKLDFQMQKDYRTVIDQQMSIQQNIYRYELLKMVFEGSPLNGVKAAIKLGKLELAFYICYRYFMSHRILSRVRNDISHAMLAFLVDHNKQQYEPFFDEIKVSIRPAVFQLNKKFIFQVYHKRQNLDLLLEKFFPKQIDKYRYWGDTLVLSRADELLKMEASNKLKNIQYQPEYESLPIEQKDQFMKQNEQQWRSRIMNQLGIADGNSTTPWVNDYVGWVNRSQQVDQSQEVQQSAVQEAQQQAPVQAEADTSIQPDPVATQEASALQNSGNQAAQQNSESITTADAAEQIQNSATPDQIQNVTATPDQIQSVAATQESQIPAERTEQNEEQKENVQAQFTELFERDKRLRIKGYDFNNFLDLARSKIRPMYEKQYEEEKQFKKSFLELQAIAEEANILDCHYLQERLDLCKSKIKNPHTIEVLKAFQIWDFDFLNVDSPRFYPWKVEAFRQNFYNFKSYQGRHLAPYSFVTQPQDLENFLLLRNISKAMINDMLVNQRKYFDEAEAVVKLKPCQQVEDLMIWGLQNDQPMAIYIGEKLAMITNQIISHDVAIRVSQYLSHRRDIPSERIQRCKQCLKIVGRINRDHIYDFSKDYQHITTRKHFHKYLTQLQEDTDSPSLDFLSRINPLAINHQQPINIMNDLKRGRFLS